jgi:hypothetical protein
MLIPITPTTSDSPLASAMPGHHRCRPDRPRCLPHAAPIRNARRCALAGHADVQPHRLLRSSCRLPRHRADRSVVGRVALRAMLTAGPRWRSSASSGPGEPLLGGNCIPGAAARWKRPNWPSGARPMMEGEGTRTRRAQASPRPGESGARASERAERPAGPEEQPLRSRGNCAGARWLTAGRG